ncbi:P-loop containing nucleoside triphosphate hydrolase protein [Tylopilus felleus]
MPSASLEHIVSYMETEQEAEPDGPNVLHNHTFHVRTGERIGVVGRTGSGKGEVYYDGFLTSSIEREVLRSSLTILPQSAELLNGTIRQNLDPFGHFEDATLHDALRAAGVSELQAFAQEGDTPRLTLDTAGGANLSIGQRQIVALARAMITRRTPSSKGPPGGSPSLSAAVCHTRGES